MTIRRWAGLGIVVALTVGSAALAGQEWWRSRPRRSPHESVSGTVDGDRITITYGRPYMRGRTIWGGLVRWGRVWAIGADEAAILDTERPLVVRTTPVPAGQYSLYMFVDEKAPKLIINRQTGQFHTEYHEDRDFARIDLQKAEVSPPVEQLTLSIEPKPGGGGIIALTWADRRYAMPFTVATK